LFDAFPTLGQLSLFGPVPTDEEAWELKPSVLRHSRGLILYEALGNVGTSSVLRREIWDRGVRVTNVQSQGSFLFPDDSALSRHIKELGYLVAWADHYLVRNVGHCSEEFAKHPDYYRENYTSKHWLGVEGWQRRTETQRVQPRPFRSTFLPVGSALSPEKSSPRSECPEPQLWSMLDGWTAEVETLEFLYSLARLLKPKFIVETGTWHGHAACAMGHALRANGRGRLATLEIDAASCAVATSNVEAAQLSKLVEVVNCDSLQYAPPQRIDLLLLDSDLAAREPEFWHFAPSLSPGAFVVFHDTSEIHAIVREGVSRIVRAGALRTLSFATPRGLMLCQSVALDEASDNAVDRSPRS
jgi:predicted O-methyltransferase YrrM